MENARKKRKEKESKGKLEREKDAGGWKGVRKKVRECVCERLSI